MEPPSLTPLTPNQQDQGPRMLPGLDDVADDPSSAGGGGNSDTLASGESNSTPSPADGPPSSNGDGDNRGGGNNGISTPGEADSSHSSTDSKRLGAILEIKPELPEHIGQLIEEYSRDLRAYVVVGDVKSAKKWLEDPQHENDLESIFKRNSLEESLLDIATKQENIPMLELLLEKASGSQGLREGLCEALEGPESSLILATKSDEVLLLLLHAQTEVSKDSWRFWGWQTPLHVAVLTENLDVVNAVLKLFPVKDHVSEDSRYSESLRSNDSKEAGEILVDVAVRGGLKDITSALIDAGADVNWTDWLGRTGLDLAAELLLPGIVAIFVKKGANVNRTGIHFGQDSEFRGYTPLQMVVVRDTRDEDHTKKRIRVLEELLRHPEIKLSATAEFKGKQLTALEMLEDSKIQKRLGKKAVKEMQALFRGKYETLIGQALDQDNSISPKTPRAIIGLIADKLVEP